LVSIFSTFEKGGAKGGRTLRRSRLAYINQGCLEKLKIFFTVKIESIIIDILLKNGFANNEC